MGLFGKTTIDPKVQVDEWTKTCRQSCRDMDRQVRSKFSLKCLATFGFFRVIALNLHDDFGRRSEGGGESETVPERRSQEG
jgi:hypothetical protein